MVVLVLGSVGTGILGEPWNEIKLWVQELGWSEQKIVSPITAASIEIRLESVPSQEPIVNIVTACGFHSDEEIPPGKGKSDGMIICKLLNEDGNAIAEGSIPITSYMPSDTLIIDINQPIFIGANEFGNVWDAMALIKGPL